MKIFIEVLFCKKFELMNSLMNKEIGDINGDGEVGGRVVDDIFGE